MIEQIINYLTEQFHSNQFLQGGALIGLLGSGFYYLRSIPMLVWSKIRKRIFTEITINDSESRALFDVFEWYFAKEGIAKRTRRYEIKENNIEAISNKINTELKNIQETFQGSPKTNKETNSLIQFTPAIGMHWFWKNRRLFVIDKRREEKEQRVLQSYNMKIFSRNIKYIEDWIANIILQFKENVKEDKTSKIYVCQNGHYDCYGINNQRTKNDVILPEGMIEDIYEDIEQFMNRESYYRQRGIPYRRGYLFHGIPGTGKTSLTKCIANDFGMNLYLLNLNTTSEQSFYDSLRSIIADSRKFKILLLEDIDCIDSATNRDKSTQNSDKFDAKVSLATLLNGIDGIVPLDNTIIIMTTNKKYKLDPALIRTGRIDKQYEFNYADRYQAQKLFQLHYPDSNGYSEEFANKFLGNKTTSDLQELFLSNKMEDLIK